MSVTVAQKKETDICLNLNIENEREGQEDERKITHEDL